MSKEIRSANDEARGDRRYDLEERTAVFGEAIIVLLKTFAATPITTPLISQLVRAATSVGVNYCEADDAVRKKNSAIESVYVNVSVASRSIGCGC
jgi:four helix bundle protein